MYNILSMIRNSLTRFRSLKRFVHMANSTSDVPTGKWRPNNLKALFYGPDSVANNLVPSLPSPGSKAFIVTGNSLASKTGLIKEIEQLLKEHHAGTFSRIGQHAPVAQLDEATELILKDPSIDTVISVGGGSPIDSAKAISYRVNEKTGKFLYHITIPTTISAAECTAGAGYTSSDGLKVSVGGPELLARVIIYDPKFALETPQRLWLSTGMRSLDHAMETMYHPEANEISRLMALQAASKLFKYLPKYKANPKDEAVITQLQLACYSSLGLLGATTRPLGLSHTLGYALGSPYSIPHGITSCLTLGHVVKLMAMNPSAADEISRMAPFIGLEVKSGSTKQETATAVGQKVLDLVKELDLYTTLTDWKVGKDQVPIIVQRATRGKLDDKMQNAVTRIVEGLYEREASL